jgi:guanosine-3',5'-bis(diphosphate) 3'-pyrophosphohydrolase
VSNELWQKAASFAAKAHRHQTRKDGQTPYFAHPCRVALTASHVFQMDDPVLLAAALLHDTIEDGATDYDDLLREFGPEVAELVGALTKDKRLPEDAREREFHAALVRAPWKARLIKLADAYDNLADAATPAMATKARAKAVHALELAHSPEPELQRAAVALRELLASATQRQGT